MPEGRRPEPKALRRQVIRLLEADLAADGFDLLDVRVFQGGGRFQVRVYVDLLVAAAEPVSGAGAGISLDEVARVSRTVDMLLEEAELFADRYVIEVSSPGIRRPLRTPEHFRRAIGEKIDLKVTGVGRVRGLLQEMDDVALVVLRQDAEETGAAAGDDSGMVSVPLGQIAEANLDPEFDVQAIINADRRERKESKRLERAQRKGRKKSRPRARKTPDGPAESNE